MPLQLDFKKKLNTRTERVKSVDFHPTEPWVLSALYTGHLLIHNWEEQVTVKTIEVCSNTAIRCAKFIARKQWVICGSDDMLIRIFNYNSMEKVKEFDAHNDFIRYIAVHPSMPLVLTASDDMSVRLWDWSRNWGRVASFEGHLHYVMMCQWNPKDPHIFATASLDRSIKVWGTQAPGVSAGGVVNRPHFNLIGHESGVNSIEYSPNGEKPYIVSGGDDKTIRIWDYQTKQCVTVLSDHTKLVSCAAFHPYLPIILSGSEDCRVKVWHATTYRQEMTINYDMGRIWGIATDVKTNAVALATDEGTVVIKIGSDRAVASMQGGKIIIAKGSDIQTVNVRLTDDSLFSDGERLPLSLKEMGACEIFPQSIKHHPNGRLISVCGDGEYVVYTAQALRNKAYGRALDFVWSSDGHYAVRDDTGKVSVYHNFKEHLSFVPPYPVEEVFGGKLICLRSTDFICFYDWQELKLKRRINVTPDGVYWNDIGSHVVLACQDSFFLLRYDPNATAQNEEEDDEDGIENSFELEKEIMEKVESGTWVADCFAFTTSRLRLHTLTAGMVDTLAFLDKPAWLLGYLSDTNRLYLIDRDHSVVSYRLHLSFVEYLAAICRRDFETASQIFKKIPEELHNKVARFLEWQGQRETALEVTKDIDHKFELGCALGKLELCAKVIQEASLSKGSSLYYKNQWRQLGDLALERGAINLADACFQEGSDFNSLLLIYSSIGDIKGLEHVAAQALRSGDTNVAIICYVLLQDHDKCLEVLLDADRIPEAALFARTYAPSRVADILSLWKQKLIAAKYESIADSLADPQQHPDFFPNFDAALAKEINARNQAQQIREGRCGTSTLLRTVGTTVSSKETSSIINKPDLLNAENDFTITPDFAVDEVETEELPHKSEVGDCLVFNDNDGNDNDDNFTGLFLTAKPIQSTKATGQRKSSSFSDLLDAFEDKNIDFHDSESSLVSAE